MKSPGKRNKLLTPHKVPLPPDGQDYIDHNNCCQHFSCRSTLMWLDINPTKKKDNVINNTKNTQIVIKITVFGLPLTFIFL